MQQVRGTAGCRTESAKRITNLFIGSVASTLLNLVTQEQGMSVAGSTADVSTFPRNEASIWVVKWAETASEKERQQIHVLV